MTEPYAYLLPEPDDVTQAWWDAIRRHELLIQECGNCKTPRHPPTRGCRNCGSEAVEWRRVSGNGTLYSFVIVHQSALPKWRDAVPYNVAIVELNDLPAIRVYGNVVECDNSALRIGLRLHAVFDDVGPDDAILRWRIDE